MCLYFSHLFLHTPHFILTQKRRFGSDRLMHNDRCGGIHTAATVSLAVQGMALTKYKLGCNSSCPIVRPFVGVITLWSTNVT